MPSTLASDGEISCPQTGRSRFFLPTVTGPR